MLSDFMNMANHQKPETVTGNSFSVQPAAKPELKIRVSQRMVNYEHRNPSFSEPEGDHPQESVCPAKLCTAENDQQRI